MSRSSALIEHFTTLDDPRTGNAIRHRFDDILIIALCAAVAGADGWTDTERFAHAKHDWLGQFLELPRGIPSHDTFARVFSLIDPDAFVGLFAQWTGAVAVATDQEVAKLDGKTLRRSYDRYDDRAALQMVSAWASESGLVLAQVPVEGGSNEIAALPRLLALLHLKGCIVTIDAAGCQHEIAEQIVAQEADYLLALKDNQKLLRQDVAEYFEQARREGFAGRSLSYHEQTDGGHGRVEVRRCWAFEDVGWLHKSKQWSSLRSFAVVESERHLGEERACERRYFISSLSGDAAHLLTVVRKHWGVENCVHWVLDVVFAEDQSRVRERTAATNLALLRRLALNMLRQNGVRDSVRGKRQRAGWDDGYLARLLGFQMR